MEACHCGWKVTSSFLANMLEWFERGAVGGGKAEEDMGSLLWKEHRRREQFTQTLDKWVQCCSFASAWWECSGYHYRKAVRFGNAKLFSTACPNPTKFLALTEWLAASFGMWEMISVSKASILPMWWQCVSLLFTTTTCPYCISPFVLSSLACTEW